MAQHRITDRQLMALLACYDGQRPHYRAAGTYGDAHEKAGKPYWTSQTNMGGAVSRMVEDLRTRGYITDFNRYEAFGDKSSSDLTVKGFEAIEERLGKLPKSQHWTGARIFDFNEFVKLDELRERKEQRRQREAEMVRLRAAAAEQARQEAQQDIEVRRTDQLRRMRGLLSELGIGDNWSDDKVLGFGRDVADAMRRA
jgi:hypothetical protein